MPKDNSTGNELKPNEQNDFEDSESSSHIEDNWQASKTTVRERMAVLFNKEMYADVHFKVGKGSSIKRIPAHKLVLSVGSSVFDAMFNGGLAANSDEIDIPDVEPAAFNALLRYLYSDKIIIGAETVLATLYAAKKYAVPALEEHCVKFLEDDLTADNAFMLLTQALLFDEPKLVTMCSIIIDKNTDGALAADGFTDVDLDTLCCILSRDSLHIKEVELFRAVVRWSEAECGRKDLPVTPENQKAVSGPALKLIRFPLMTIDEFAVNVAQSRLLTDKEILSLFLYFVLNPKPSVDFSDTTRNIDELSVILCTELNAKPIHGFDISDRIRFKVDQSIIIIGFGLYVTVCERYEFDVFIELIDTSTNNVVSSKNCSLISDGSLDIVSIYLDKPVQVLSNTSYIASVRMPIVFNYNQYFENEGLQYYGKLEMEKVSVDTSVGKIMFYFENSSEDCTQIAKILFCAGYNYNLKNQSKLSFN